MGGDDLDNNGVLVPEIYTDLSPPRQRFAERVVSESEEFSSEELSSVSCPASLFRAVGCYQPKYKGTAFAPDGSRSRYPHVGSFTVRVNYGRREGFLVSLFYAYLCAVGSLVS